MAEEVVITIQNGKPQPMGSSAEPVDSGGIIIPRQHFIIVPCALGPVLVIDGVAYVTIPAILNGFNLTDIIATIETADASTGVSLQIYNVTQATDMLTTNCTIDANETSSLTAATPFAIDTSNDDVTTGDQLRLDCDVAGTNALNLSVVLSFKEVL